MVISFQFFFCQKSNLITKLKSKTIICQTLEKKSFKLAAMHVLLLICRFFCLKKFKKTKKSNSSVKFSVFYFLLIEVDVNDN